MADRNFVGARLRVATSDGNYEGTVHSIDTEKRKLTLTKGEQLVPFKRQLFPYFASLLQSVVESSVTIVNMLAWQGHLYRDLAIPTLALYCFVHFYP